MYICKEGNQPGRFAEEAALPTSLKMVEGLQPKLEMLVKGKGAANKVYPTTERVDGIIRKNDRTLNSLLRITKSVWLHRYAWPFYEPVDAVALNIPHYYQVITYPMDLGTIKRRLETNFYNSAEECMNDLRAMFKNCYFFNDKKTDIYQMAEVLEAFLKEKLKSGIGYDWTLLKKSKEHVPTIDPTHGKEKLVKPKMPTKRTRNPSVDSESDVSSSSETLPPQVKRPNLTPQKIDAQKENKPDSRKEEEKNQQILECFKLLKKYFIKKNKYAWPFEQSLGPSWKAQPQPNASMKEVKKWLKKSLYKDIRQFCADMISIFKNTGKYQFPWTNPHRMAAALAHYIKSKDFKYRVVFSSEELMAPQSSPAKAPTPTLQQPQVVSVPLAKPSLAQNINHNNQSVVPNRKRGRPKKIVSVAESSPRPMTQKESEELNIQLSQVPEQAVYQIVELVRETQPELIIKKQDTFEVDFENAKPILQWKIKSMIEGNNLNVPTLVKKEEAKSQEADVKRLEETKKPLPSASSSSHPNIPTRPVINHDVQKLGESKSSKPIFSSQPSPKIDIPTHQPTQLLSTSGLDGDAIDDFVDIESHTPDTKSSPKCESLLPEPGHQVAAPRLKSGQLIADEIILNLLKKSSNTNITDKIRPCESFEPQEKASGKPIKQKTSSHLDKMKHNAPYTADSQLEKHIGKDENKFRISSEKKAKPGPNKLMSPPEKTKPHSIFKMLGTPNHLEKKVPTPKTLDKSKQEKSIHDFEKQRTQPFSEKEKFERPTHHLEKSSNFEKLQVQSFSEKEKLGRQPHHLEKSSDFEKLQMPPFSEKEKLGRQPPHHLEKSSDFEKLQMPPFSEKEKLGRQPHHLEKSSAFEKLRVQSFSEKEKLGRQPAHHLEKSSDFEKLRMQPAHHLEKSSDFEKLRMQSLSETEKLGRQPPHHLEKSSDFDKLRMQSFSETEKLGWQPHHLEKSSKPGNHLPTLNTNDKIAHQNILGKPNHSILPSAPHKYAKDMDPRAAGEKPEMQISLKDKPSRPKATLEKKTDLFGPRNSIKEIVPYAKVVQQDAIRKLSGEMRKEGNVPKENSRPRLQSVCKTSSSTKVLKTRPPETNEKILHINESLISSQSNHVADLQAPQIETTDHKQLMKELSRINRQNYAKTHHVNFCTNAETQDYFDQLGLTFGHVR